MAKQVAAQIAGYGNKGIAGNPASDPPQQIVRGDQRRQQQQAQPRITNAAVDVQSRRQRIHQNLDTVLRAHRATDRTKDGDQDRGMRNGPLFYVMSEKRKRTLSVPVSVVHVDWTPVQMRLYAELATREHAPGFPGT